MVSKVPAFSSGSTGSIPGGVRNFNLNPGTGYVTIVCVISSVVYGGDPDIVLTTHSGRPVLVYLSSVLIHSLLLPLQASDPQAFGLLFPGVKFLHLRLTCLIIPEIPGFFPAIS